MTVKEGDACGLFNFPSDRARELTKACASEFRQVYARTDFQSIFNHVYGIRKGSSGSGRASSTDPSKLPRRELSQTPDSASFHIAETEKYAHVTFF